MTDILNAFFEEIRTGNIEVYNEFSLQHELGIYLRNLFPELKIQFERNTSFFDEGVKNLYKHEMDICGYRTDSDGNITDKEFAIELKFPLNGQHPEEMYAFITDIGFLEQVKTFLGFKKAYAITLVNDMLFYSDRASRKLKTNGIYGFFRKEEKIEGVIEKPTGKDKTSVNISKSYIIKWNHVGSSDMRYYIVEIE